VASPLTYQLARRPVARAVRERHTGNSGAPAARAAASTRVSESESAYSGLTGTLPRAEPAQAAGRAAPSRVFLGCLDSPRVLCTTVVEVDVEAAALVVKYYVAKSRTWLTSV
jgi:hypothetical protein